MGASGRHLSAQIKPSWSLVLKLSIANIFATRQARNHHEEMRSCLLTEYPRTRIVVSRRSPAPGEKPVLWVGSSKRDLLDFPASVISRIGMALAFAQFGEKHPCTKPWRGAGSGVFEIVQDFAGNTYRGVYTVRFPKAVCVLHCFQKKSPHGISTARPDIQLILARLHVAQTEYEKRHGSIET